MGDIYTNPPQSRNEAILRATIDGIEYTDPPQSRIEDLLLQLKAAIEEGGGTGEGDMKKSVYDPDRTVAQAGGIEAYVTDEISTKADKSVVDDILDGTSIDSFADVETALADKADTTALADEHNFVVEQLGWTGKNLCNPETFVQGLINHATGNVGYSDRWITSDYIPCSGTVTISGWKDGNESNFAVRFAEYDSSKNFIKDTTDINISANAYYSRTITLNSNTRFVRITLGFDNKTCTPSAYFAINRVQLELGSTATSYEPYHTSVEETLTTKTDNSVIAPIENGTNASQAYAVGQHFIRDGAFCTCTQAIAQGGTFTLGTNYVKGTIADNLIKKDNATITTNSNGVALLYNGSDRNVLAVKAITGDKIVFTFLGNNATQTYCKVINYSDLSPVASQEVNLEYYYI